MAVDVGSAVGYLDLDISGFLAGLKSAQSEADTSSKNIATKIRNNLSSAGKSLTSAGKTLTKTVTVPVLGLGTAVVKATSDFESAMSRVQAISGASGKDLLSLTNKAKELGETTAWSATEVADGMTEMAKAGWSAQEIIDGMGGVLDAASASGENLASVSTIVADAITGFGLEARDATKVADLLTQAANSGTIDIADLGESFKYIAPQASAMGLSIKEVTTAISAMSTAGIKGSQAGTSLSGVLSRLTGDNDKVRGTMKELGIVITNSDGSFKSLNDIVGILRDSFSGMTDEEKAYYATILAGQEGQKGLLSLLNLTEEEYNEIAKSMNNANGVAKETANVMLNNLSGQVTILKSALEGLAIQFGEIILPYLKRFVKWVQNLTQKLRELTPEQKEQIVKWAAIVAAIGPVLKVLGKLTSYVGSIITTFGKIPGAIKAVTGGFTKLTTAGKNVFEGFKLAKAGFTALGAQASPLGAALAGVTAPMIAIVAAVALVIAAFVSLWKTNEEFRNKITAIWDGIKAKFEAFAQGIVDRLNVLGFDFKNFTQVVKAIWDGFCSVLAPIFEAAFEIISNVLGTALDVLTGLLDVFIGLFTGNWKQMWAGIKKIASSIWNSISSLFKSISETLLGSLKTWGSNMISAAKSSATNFFNNVSNVIRRLPGKIAKYLSQIISKVTSWVKDMGTKGKQGAKNMFNSVKNGLSNLPSIVLNIGKNVVQGLWNGISGTAGWLYSKVSSFASSIVGTIKRTLGINSPSTVMRDKIGKWLPPGIGEGFKVALPDAMDDIKNQFNTNIDKLRGKLHTLQVTGAKVSEGVDFNFDEFDTGGGSFDYKTLAKHLAEVLKDAPIQVPVNIEMQDGDIIMDSERVGRKVAPVVSRVVVQGL